MPKRELETQDGGTKRSHCSDDAGATAEVRFNPTIVFLEGQLMYRTRELVWGGTWSLQGLIWCSGCRSHWSLLL